MCSCQHREAIHCAALERDIPFYQAMGLGYSCPCSCHKRTDAQMVENFKEFLREVSRLEIKLNHQ